MIINDPELYKKKMDEERRLCVADDQRKEMFWSELKNESLGVITLAVMYAKNFEETGEDLTKCLINVDKNADLLQRVYNKGYEEGIYKGRELEREYQKNKGNHNNNTTSNSINSKGRNH